MTRKNRVTSILVTCFLGITLVAGCKKEETPPPPAVPPAKPASVVQKSVSGAKAGAQKALSSARTSSVNAIDFASKKDPFKPAVTAPLPTEKKGEQPVKRAGDLLPIQSYETEKFRVVGIITGIRENRALMIDPSGKAYVVRQGMAVGSSDGIVTKVNPNSVEIVEKFRDDNGHVRKRTVKLTLTRKK